MRLKRFIALLMVFTTLWSVIPVSAVEDIEIWSVNTLSQEIIDKITGVSWIPNEDIQLEDLRHVIVTHWGFDDKPHIGELIVHEKVADDVLDIFKELYNVKFPIEKIRLIDEYNADDNLSMQDNNTSAFCYRAVTGGSSLSKHSYGLAIDINPVQNPYIKDNIVLPKNGEEFINRDDIRKGMIVKKDACYTAFKKKGWDWGGDWHSLKDYQHFQKKIKIDKLDK